MRFIAPFSIAVALLGAVRYTVAGISSPSLLHRSPKDGISSNLSDRDDKKEFIIYPKNGKDEIALKNTEENIKKVAQVQKVFSYRDVNKALLMWTIPVTDEQLQAIKKDNNVELTEENIVAFEEDATVPRPSPAAQLTNGEPHKFKRALEYKTQIKAASELVMVSQPTTVPNLRDLDSYVYEKKGGKGSYVYHVELGIAAWKQDEFPPDQVEFLQSPRSLQENQPKDKDGGGPGDSHSTCTASKAVGQTYGTAKGATLVVVKMADNTLAETGSIFDFVWQDIKSKKRQKKSVVTVSLVSKTPIDPDKPDTWFMAQRREHDQIKVLLDNDVIVVASAGNHAKENGSDGKPRVNIDTAPTVFEGPDYPIIAIGATDFTGMPTDFSQGGDHLTILGPGKDINCQDKATKAPLVVSGTSFSAPLVAGVLANFLVYDKVPFDTSDGKVAANAKKYLQDTANWARQPGVKVIWNGVTEANNPKKGGGTK